MWYNIKWYARWFVMVFPTAVYRRLRYCRHGHGPMYDCVACLTCYAPWFRSSLIRGRR